MAPYVMGKVITPSDELLNDDLNFQYSDAKRKSKKRKIASQKSENNEENRDIANEEGVESTPKVPFWDY